MADEINANYFDITVQRCATELRRLHAEAEQHLQELRSYRITVENREARIAELESQLAAAQQGVQPFHREWKSALQEAIDTMDAEIDIRGDAENVRRMKRAKTVLTQMLATHPTIATDEQANG